MQLHAGHRLRKSGQEEGCNQPILEPDLRSLHDRSRLGGELLAAFLLTASEGHGLVLAAGLYVHRTTVGAAHSSRPELLDEPCLCRGVIGEHLHDLLEGNAPSERFSWRLCHASGLQESGEIVEGKVEIIATSEYHPLIGRTVHGWAEPGGRGPPLRPTSPRLSRHSERASFDIWGLRCCNRHGPETRMPRTRRAALR